MIIILKKGTAPQKVNEMVSHFEQMNFQVQEIRGVHETILGLIGDTSRLDTEDIKSMDSVAEVKRIQEPYKNANRKFHPDDTVIDVCGRKIGGGHFQVIAGPCSVESEEQICAVAQAVKASGAQVLRGGAFKPRTSPYSFQGLREQGLEYLLEAKKASGLPIVTEIMSIDHLPLFENVDIIQVGARNMQNFELLKELGKVNKPILLKRGLANTIEELLMSAEYIMAGGNKQVILCERGIRTFETATRNTLDISAIPIIPPAGHHRPQPRRRHSLDGSSAFDGCHRGRRGRPDYRGAQQPRKGAVRRRSIADPGTVRRGDAGRQARRHLLRQDDGLSLLTAQKGAVHCANRHCQRQHPL